MTGPHNREDRHGLIDVHAHFLPQALISALRGRAESPKLVGVGDETILDYGQGYIERIGRPTGDIDRLMRAMDRNGVATSVVSINQPGVVGMPASEAAVIAKDVNDELLGHVSNNASRLAGLGTLPLQDPDAAVAELERITGTGLSGAIVFSNVNGTSIAEPQFRPIFEAAEHLEAPLLLHPVLPIGAEKFQCYDLTVPFGFLVDTTMTAIQLILGGVYDRQPKLKLIIGHAGSLLPQIAGRIDLEAERNPAVRGRLTDLPSKHLKLMYTDTVGGWAPAVRSALSLFGASHVMFGSDFPFWDQGPSVAIMSELADTAEPPEGVVAENAIRLFRLNLPSKLKDTKATGEGSR